MKLQKKYFETTGKNKCFYNETRFILDTPPPYKPPVKCFQILLDANALPWWPLAKKKI